MDNSAIKDFVSRNSIPEIEERLAELGFEVRERDNRFVAYWNDGDYDSSGLMIFYDSETGDLRTEDIPEFVSGDVVVEDRLESYIDSRPDTSAGEKGYLWTRKTFKGREHLVDRYRDIAMEEAESVEDVPRGGLKVNVDNGLRIDIERRYVTLVITEDFEGDIPAVNLLRQMEPRPTEYRLNVKGEWSHADVERTIMGSRINHMESEFWSLGDVEMGEDSVEREFNEALEKIDVPLGHHEEDNVEVDAYPGRERIPGGAVVGYVDYRIKKRSPDDMFEPETFDRALILGRLREDGFEPVREDMEDLYKGILNDPRAPPHKWEFHDGPVSPARGAAHPEQETI